MSDSDPIAEKIQRYSKAIDEREREANKRERIKRTLQKFDYNHQVEHKASHMFGIADGKWLTRDEKKVIAEMERE